MATSGSGESVIRRIARIMGAFTRTWPVKSSADLARATGISTSTVHSLASELAREGFLERDEVGRFVVGDRLWELAARSNPLDEFRRRGLPFLEGVHAAVSQHVSLAVPDVEDGTVLYVERLDQYGNAVMNLGQVAARLGITSTSPGLAILAHQPSEVRERFAVASEDDGGRGLRATLAEVRRTGFGRLVSGLVEANVGYAVPVFGPGSGKSCELVSYVLAGLPFPFP